MSNLVNLPQAETVACACCGARAVQMSWETQSFVYSERKDNNVVLTSVVPVFSCSACEEQYTDHRAEVIRHEAVCHYLNRLTPSEIRSIRDKYDMSQAEFGAVTGLGTASIKRWETGALIQGAAYDNLLRLLENPSNMNWLSEKDWLRASEPVRFRTEITAISRAASHSFKLRLHG